MLVFPIRRPFAELADVFGHSLGRADVVGLGEHVGRALRMSEHDERGIAFAETADVVAGKRSCTSQWPFQAMISTLVFEATYFARYSSGKKMTRGTPSASTICTALPLVTQTSDSALTSADVFT